MSKKLNEVTVGEHFLGFLAVKECSIRTASNGSNYLAMVLTDGKTAINARLWEHSGVVPSTNTVIKVQGLVSEYHGQLQLTVNKWRQANQDEYFPGDFLPVHPDIDGLKSRLKQYVESIKDSGLSQLLQVFLNDVDTLKAFTEAPAAIIHHHVYIGGLLHHTVGVVEQCLRFVTSETDKDMLVTGAIFHDIGKIHDYDWSGVAFLMTDNGRLLGHITQGLLIVNDYARKCPGLSSQRLSLLQHLILSHHGKLEWGSPVEPCTLEAVLLHEADMLDVQLHKIDTAIKETRTNDGWTDKIAGMNRKFYITYKK
jgi:3'-5' exoribonuclease